MTFASSSDVSDLKDIIYGIDLRVQAMEEELKELRKIVTKTSEMVERNKVLGRLK